MPAPAVESVVGRHFRTGLPIRWEFSEGRVVRCAECEAPADTLPWLAPGFIDLQSNGYGGQEFSSLDLTPERVAEIARLQASFGVTQFCPTVTTASRETVTHAVRTIDTACRACPDVNRVVAGIHVEGPYITPIDGSRGAHPLEHCRPPDWQEFQAFQAAAQGRIRILTLSPEYPGAPAFIRQAVASGVVVALGHMVATGTQIRAAVDAGASLSTHLGNGAQGTLRRHPNYLWDQMAEDRLMASLIVDGHHLPPEVVKCLVRVKTPKRCVLVSDFSGLAGLPPGRYGTQLCELEILADGRLVIADQEQLLAGASRPIGDGVAKVMQYAGVDLATAVDMASANPGRLLGQAPRDWRPGSEADAVLFRLDSGAAGPRLRVEATVTRGITACFAT